MPSDSEIFLKAIDVLEVRGWAQTRWEDDEGAVCIEGAIRIACSAPASFRGLTTADIDSALIALRVTRRLCALLCEPVLFFWNDAPERTYEDVVSALKRASVGEAAIQW